MVTCASCGPQPRPPTAALVHTQGTDQLMVSGQGSAPLPCPPGSWLGFLQRISGTHWAVNTLGGERGAIHWEAGGRRVQDLPEAGWLSCLLPPIPRTQFLDQPSPASAWMEPRHKEAANHCALLQEHAQRCYVRGEQPCGSRWPGGAGLCGITGMEPGKALPGHDPRGPFRPHQGCSGACSRPRA